LNDDQKKAELLDAARIMFLSGHGLGPQCGLQVKDSTARKNQVAMSQKTLSERGLIREVTKVVPCTCLHALDQRAMALDKVVLCANCKKSDSECPMVMMTCARCKSIKYCSTPCQIADWKAHKRACYIVSEEKKSCFHGFYEIEEKERQFRFDKITESGERMNMQIGIHDPTERLAFATKVSHYMNANSSWFDEDMVKFCYFEAANGLLKREEKNDERFKAQVLGGAQTLFLSGHRLGSLLGQKQTRLHLLGRKSACSKRQCQNRL
jgi:hypothetical protein